MVYIHSAIAEIKCGKKKIEEETTGKISCPHLPRRVAIISI